MTKYFDLYIITNDQLTLDSVMAEIPTVVDSRIWNGEYREPKIITTDYGDRVLNASIHFKEDTGRDEVFDAIQNIQEIFTECLAGSIIRLVESYNHDNPEDERPCEITAIFEVVA
ncbi:hypothetical protein KAR91_10890 [Candidatus Pacearchaeota archaeon]|nr:hypothetical protein [Candidatus Pacearchaeota archaeon]